MCFSPKRYTRLLNRQKSGVLDEAWCFLKPSAQNGCFGVFWEPQAILGGLTHGRSWGQLPPMSRSKLTVRHRKSPIYKWRFSSLRKPSISMGHGLTMAMLVITWGYILRNSNVLTIWSIEFRNICSQPSCRKAGSKGNHILEATAKLHAQNILPFLVQNSSDQLGNVPKRSTSWLEILPKPFSSIVLKICWTYVGWPVWCARKNSVSSTNSKAPGFAVRWNTQAWP